MRQVGVAIVSALLIGGCVGQPPTPEPFPIPGVRQLTSDSSYYRGLMWSPDGEWIAATRCPIIQFQPSCLGNEEPLLVAPDTGEVHVIDFKPVTPNHVSSHPVAWSESGNRLLLYVEVSPSSEPAPLSEREIGHIAYAPDGETFELVHDQPDTVLGWNDRQTMLLLLRAAAGGELEVGWLDYSSGEFSRLFGYEQDRLVSTHALSPDRHRLLRGDSADPVSCSEVDSLELDGAGEFDTLATMACFPAWSGDGMKIAYAQKDDPGSEPNQLIIANPDGSDPQSLFGVEQFAFLASPTWSPDGTQIAFTKGWLEGVNAIYIASVPKNLRP